MTTSISTFRSALLTAALALCPLAAALHAESPQPVKVNIPFAFQLGSQTLPAGVYTITRTSSHLFALAGQGKSGFIMGQSEDSLGKIDGPSKVVFQHYGDKYFLREVWRAGSEDHTVLVRTPEETRARKAYRSDVAAAIAPATTVEVSQVSASR